MKTKIGIQRVVVSYHVMSTHPATWRKHLLSRWQSTGMVGDKVIVHPAEASRMIDAYPPSRLQIGAAQTIASVARKIAQWAVETGGIGTKIVVKLHAVTTTGKRERLPDQSISLDGQDMPTMPDLDGRLAD